MSIGLVTGGASGIGKAIAERLAADGCTVVFTDIDAKAGQATASACGLAFIRQDVADESSWSAVLDEVESRYGPLTILVNNAGTLGGVVESFDPEHISLETWRRTFRVNVEGTFLGCRAGIRVMRASGVRGAIINIPSVAGLQATPHATAYGASKAAVGQLTRSVAQYCGEQGLPIRCNSVHPGIVRTALWDEHAKAESSKRGVPLEQLVNECLVRVPLQQFATPSDVAAAVAFLASSHAAHVTGAQLVVDGGSMGCDTFRSREIS
jgi:3(or 17)beta-hydroxysteroid dehydrogenase